VTDDDRLEHYRLKSLDLGQLTGAAMAIHAIPDAFLLKHTGVGCKHKTVTQFGTHELAKGLAAHEGWTEVGDASLIRGSANRLGPYARSSYARHKPAFLGVASVTFLDLAGDDFGDQVRQLDDELPCAVAYLKVPGFEGDLWSGYLTTMLEVVKRMDWKAAPDRPTHVAMHGYLWDRYEGDHQGNLTQLHSLVKALGLEPGPVLLSGAAYADLCEAPRAGLQLQLPYAAPKARALKRATKRELIPVDLPIGLRGSAAFLRTVGRAAGVAPDRVEAIIRRQEDSVRQRLGTIADRLRGLQVAVFADLPLLVGAITVLDELGLSVRVAGIRGHTLGGKVELLAALDRLGVRLPEGCQVLENPSLARVRDVVGAGLAARQLDGVLGSATDHNALRTLPPTPWLSSWAGEQMTPTGPFRLEIGFPCLEHHCAWPMPTMGFAGVLIWAQRLLSAPRLWDAGRGAGV
jgi:nitrogenase molybdenum-iron protein alpha/beta subunit